MRRALILIAALSVSLAACSSPPPPPAAKPAAKPVAKPVEAPKPAEVAAAANAEPPFVYSYSPASKRDPFRSLVASDSAAGEVLNASSACNQPLCRWDLDQLKLVGVITGMSNPVAMVEDPQGIGHTVRRNSFMGKKGGRVTQIKHDEVVVTEIIKGHDGKPQPQAIPILLVHTDQQPSQDLLQSEAAQ